MSIQAQEVALLIQRAKYSFLFSTQARVKKCPNCKTPLHRVKKEREFIVMGCPNVECWAVVFFVKDPQEVHLDGGDCWRCPKCAVNISDTLRMQLNMGKSIACLNCQVKLVPANAIEHPVGARSYIGPGLDGDSKQVVQVLIPGKGLRIGTHYFSLNKE